MSLFRQIGAIGHSIEARQENDYYATHPIAAELLIHVEQLNNVWECACGEGHLSRVFDSHGILGKSSDLIDRGYGDVLDFFTCTDKWNGDIVTNPPYKYAQQFVEHALKLTNRKVCMFLRLQFLEGKKRKYLFQNTPLKCVYVSSSRINCAKNGLFDKYTDSATAYAWFVWDITYTGKPYIEWIN